ncbi:MAG: T9SS type A sorting domain-containing protein, partial [Candidatus Marinimicrobia bacterium]|nr:T9SS type A sorting domain-containing protein [Candidatus Neomarinimicrobiota bacterium]
PSTTINTELSESSGVSLIGYDIIGREVLMLGNRTMQPGRYEARWNGTDDLGKQVAAGMYIVRLQSGNDSKAEKIVCLR